MALFGRRPQERVDSVVIPASKNQHMSRSRPSFDRLAGAGKCTPLSFLARVQLTLKLSGRAAHFASDSQLLLAKLFQRGP
jgi:hypothetical protein